MKTILRNMNLLEPDDHMMLWSQAKFEQEISSRSFKDPTPNEPLDQFLEDLVKTNSVVQKHQSKLPFADLSIFLIHHLTREVLGTIQALRTLGCTDISCQFLGYNADAAKAFGPFLAGVPDDELRVYKLAQEEGNGDYIVDRDFIKPRDALPADALDASMKQKDYLTCQRSLASFITLQIFVRNKTSGKKTLLIEDGGYMAPLLNDAALQKLSITSFREQNSVAEDSATDNKLDGDLGEIVFQSLAGTVEHTRNGYDKVQKVYLDHGKLARPCFTIALSYVKTQFEANSVADTCINSLNNALFARGRVLRERTICVLGSRGNIGGRSVNSFSNHVKDSSKQVVGVDLKVGFSSSEAHPGWQPSPYEAVKENLLEARKFSDLPADIRKRVEVVFGVTGGRQKNSLGGFDETLLPDDIDFWLSEGESKYNELWLVSGSTKTLEFEQVMTFVEENVQRGGYKGHTLTSEDLVDPLSQRDYGQVYTFTSRLGVKKYLIAVADWKPANFMFYGVPTEDIDVILAQLVDVSVSLATNLDTPNLDSVHAVDYSPIATQGIIEAKVDPLPYLIPVPSPPETKQAQDALTNLWNPDQKIQRSGPKAQVVNGSFDEWKDLKPEGIRFDCYEGVAEATHNALSMANTIVELGVTTGYHILSVLEMQLILAGSGIVELDGKRTAIKKGDRIIVPAGTKQRHINTGSEPIQILCVCTPAFTNACYTEVEKPMIDKKIVEKAKGIVATVPYFGLNKVDQLVGKTAVVTGGEGGMGKELCRQLLNLGCRVMIAGRNSAKVDAAVQDLKEDGLLNILGVPVDVTSDHEVEYLAQMCETVFDGKLDILVNNAGVNLDPQPDLDDLTKATRTMDVNFFGPVRVTAALTPLLAKSSSGRVINVSTMLAASDFNEEDPTSPLFPIYKSSKQALNNWSREASMELQKQGIVLNCVNPGWVKTSMGGDKAPDTILDGVQATMYLATTNDKYYGRFLQRYQTEKGMVQICTRPW